MSFPESTGNSELFQTINDSFKEKKKELAYENIHFNSPKIKLGRKIVNLKDKHKDRRVSLVICAGWSVNDLLPDIKKFIEKVNPVIITVDRAWKWSLNQRYRPGLHAIM